eukprot:COSAG01_NODE_735_length_13969_cov_357.018241_13_plen_96_part_00
METEPRRHGAVSEELSRVMGSYDGSARLKRLDFLSKKALEQGDDEGMLEVSRRLHGLLKEGQNTVMYTLVCQQVRALHRLRLTIAPALSSMSGSV